VSWTHECNERRTYRMCEDFADVPIAACIGEEDALIGVLLERSFQWLANKERNEVDKLGLIRFRASISSERPRTDLFETLFSLVPFSIHYNLFLSLPFPSARPRHVHPAPTILQHLIECRIDARQRQACVSGFDNQVDILENGREFC
jgi:hypothetical protein